MKKIFRNNRLIALAFFTVFTMAAVPANLVQAQTNGSNPALPVELKYLGNNNEFALFQLVFTGNEEENAIRVYIHDVYGNSLFSETIYGNSFSKNFLLNREEMIEAPIRFEIIGRKSKKKVIFEVTRNMKYVEEMQIQNRN